MLQVHAHTYSHSPSYILVIELLCRPVVSNHPYPLVMLHRLAAGVIAACALLLFIFSLFSPIISFYFCLVSFFFARSLFPCPPVSFGTITCKVL